MTSPLSILRQLIALPSVNPAFIAPGDPAAGEERVAEYLTVTAQKARLEVDPQRIAPGRCNILIRVRPTGRVRQRIVLAPHMDTVGVNSPAQWKPVLRGGRLYGRGACDTKGSLAASLAAVLDLAKLKARPRQTEVILAALIDEEAHQAGSRALAASRFKADLAIVGEPTELRVVTAHKGDLWLELSTRGRAAHGSRPELGDNAIHRMARVVQLLETGYAAHLRRHRHPLLGCGTINVGQISGGRQPNIVPDQCAIRIDRRTLPGETDPTVKRELVAFLKRHGETVELVDTKAEEPAPPLETDIRRPLVRQFLDVARQKGAAGVDFFTDAGVLGAAGIPSVVFGPGNIAQAHTVDEWIEVAQLEAAHQMLLRYLSALP